MRVGVRYEDKRIWPATKPLRSMVCDVRFGSKDGVIGRRSCGELKILGAALQADGETRSADAASSIRRRSAAWTILRDWTYRSRTRASALWMARARLFGRLRLRASPTLCCKY